MNQDKEIVLESVSSFILAYKIIKDIGTNWKDFDAYKLGLIDDKGSKLKSPETKEEEESYNSYNKIIFNLKRLIGKTVGSNQFAQRAVSLLLLRESINETTINKIVKDLDLRNLSEENALYEKAYVESIAIH